MSAFRHRPASTASSPRAGTDHRHRGPEQPGHPQRWDLLLKHGVQPEQVHEHQLPITAVAAVAGVLGHVGVHDHPAHRRVAELGQLVGLLLAEGPPAAGALGT